MTDAVLETTAAPASRSRRTGVIGIMIIVHRWAGLAAMAWLIVLGITGVLIDHPDWRWVRQTTVADGLASPKVLRDSHGAVIRKFQADPADARRLIGGGVRGLWRTADGGVSWSAVPFAESATPMTYSIVPLSDDGWSRLVIATDDGLWLADGGDGPARRFALDGLLITSLAATPDRATLVGVDDRSRLFFMPTQAPSETQWTTPTPGAVTGLPERVGLTRLMFDLHFAQGLATDFASLAVSDFGALAVVILAATGFFFWLLPRRPGPGRRRAGAMRWLYRFHGPTVGFLAAVPIIVLCVTGVFVGHSTALGPWADTVTFDRKAVPFGAHALDTWRGQIDSIAVRSADARHLAAMTRMGLIESRDGGLTWSADRSVPIAAEMQNMNPGHAARPGLEIVGRRGTVSYLRRDDGSGWDRIEGLRSMVMDASPTQDGWLLKTSGGFHAWRPGGIAEKVATASPETGGIPLDRFLTDLHGGLMIHAEFAWFNDAVALLAVLLSITGFIAWWKRKWI
jgi:hypothetical protein